jgi:hypothetical protein
VFLAEQDVGVLLRAFAGGDLVGTAVFAERGIVPADLFLDAVQFGDARSERRLRMLERTVEALGLGSARRVDDVMRMFHAEAHSDAVKGLASPDTVAEAVARGMLADDGATVTRESFLAYWLDVSAMEPMDVSFTDLVSRCWGVPEVERSSEVRSEKAAFEGLLRDATRRRMHGTATEVSTLAGVFRKFDQRGDGRSRVTMREFADAVDHLACSVSDDILDATFMDHGEPPTNAFLNYRDYAAYVFAEHEAKLTDTSFRIGGPSRLF